jgi:hypothetical protein
MRLRLVCGWRRLGYRQPLAFGFPVGVILRQYLPVTKPILQFHFCIEFVRVHFLEAASGDAYAALDNRNESSPICSAVRAAVKAPGGAEKGQIVRLQYYYSFPLEFSDKGGAYILTI